jgi:eukaryotic translation initiation factor 2C
MKMEEIQQMSFNLCFAHQIITGMTSLPSPIYIADEMAKRGRMIFNVASS